MCSTMEELAGQDVSTYIGVIGSSLAALLAGAFPQSLWRSIDHEICGSVWDAKHRGLVTIVVQKNRNKRNARRSDASNRNTKELFFWHACKEDLEERYTDVKRGNSIS